ncbi:hypothetical protein K466DRAFT_605832 [Polyporus arcularius HHB13444]|uniref:Uncharacterized protein n=1 Tax=Polyporus arcularius HHB13444 TaxID=1314778 RepID=A0A5C3NTE5_9APHY|nr:hypothetical protein K466DRAFT_605832 [Polyporus arcularius HHB13444]
MTLATTENVDYTSSFKNGSTDRVNEAEAGGPATGGEATSDAQPRGPRTNGAAEDPAGADTESDVSDDEDSTTKSAADSRLRDESDGRTLTCLLYAPSILDYSNKQLEQGIAARTIRFQWPDTPGGVLADGMPLFAAAAEPRTEVGGDEWAETYLLSALLQVLAAQKTKFEGSLPVVADRIWRAPMEAGEEQPASAPALCIVETMLANVWNSDGDPCL